MYEVRCIFCGRDHRSEFYDELEEQILACREEATAAAKGLLRDYRHTECIIRERVIEEAERFPYLAEFV